VLAVKELLIKDSIYQVYALKDQCCYVWSKDPQAQSELHQISLAYVQKFNFQNL
jgi:hypothetical protein